MFVGGGKLFPTYPQKARSLDLVAAAISILATGSTADASYLI